jgi:hypothetical protein
MTTTTEPPLTPVPRPPRSSWLTKVYAIFGGGVLALYVVAGVRGWDFHTTERDTVPASVRTAPGGYRTFHFWHSGYHGGK